MQGGAQLNLFWDDPFGIYKSFRMAPGAFSILAPFMRRKVKKYERLETEDPEKKKQEATMEELTRINVKIVSIFLSYVAS